LIPPATVAKSDVAAVRATSSGAFPGGAIRRQGRGAQPSGVQVEIASASPFGPSRSGVRSVIGPRPFATNR
jgi:hypothetical protein